MPAQDSASPPPSAILPDDHERLVCMEVRGGNVPADVSLDAPGLGIHVLSRPYRQAAGGGDVHYVSSCGTGRITRLLLADVAGHGADVNATALVLHDLMRRHINHIDQRRFAEQINAEFSSRTDAGQFATALIATYFAPTSRLTLVNAGHPPPLLYRSAERTWSLLIDDAHPDDRAGARENYPLGVLDMTQYDEFELTLDAGDALLCYTDALPEGRDTAGELIGYDRLLASAGELSSKTALADWLRGWVTRIDAIFPGNLHGHDAVDDLTVLLLRAETGATRAPLAERLKGMTRTLVNPAAWPEISVQNLGGSLIPWLSGKKSGPLSR